MPYSIEPYFISLFTSEILEPNQNQDDIELPAMLQNNQITHQPQNTIPEIPYEEIVIVIPPQAYSEYLAQGLTDTEISNVYAFTHDINTAHAEREISITEDGSCKIVFRFSEPIFNIV